MGAVDNTLAAVIVRSLKEQPQKWTLIRRSTFPASLYSQMHMLDYLVEINVAPVTLENYLEISLSFGESPDKEYLREVNFPSSLATTFREAYGKILLTETDKLNEYLSDKVIADWTREQMAKNPDAFASGNFSS